MIKHFQNNHLEPFIGIEDFESLKKEYQMFFKKTYLSRYPCHLCEEECFPEIETTEEEMYFLCPSGFISLPQKISEKEITQYQFSIKQFSEYIAQKNNINFIFNKINSEIAYIGCKQVDNIKYDFCYLFNISTKNKLTPIGLQKILDIKMDDTKLVIITPAKILLNTTDKAFLKENNCEIISILHLIENNFLINLQDLQEYDLIVNADKLHINLYGVEYSLNNSFDTFSFIYNLAKNPKEILNVEEIRGINQSEMVVKTLAEATRKMKNRFINNLKKAFLEQNKPISILDDFIKPLNKNEQYYLNIDKEKVKVIGKLPN